MTTVDVGAVAPEFELRDQHAQLHRLADFRGRRNVLIVFYPFAFTGVCAGELQAIGEELDALQNDASQVLAVSCDPVASLRAFGDVGGFDFPLLSDFWPHGAVSSAYGVFDPDLGAASRGTFLVDRQGIVRWTVRTEMGTARDVTDYLKALAAL